MKNILKAVAVLSILSLSSCNYFAKALGGKMTIQLEKDQKLVNVSWKETDLWLLTRPKKEVEQPETYQYTEQSTFGILQGVVTIIEK